MRRTRQRVLRDAGTSLPAASVPTAGKPRAWVVPVLLQLVAMLGIGALLYPAAADWFSSRGHAAAVAGYARDVAALPDGERATALAAAQSYNTLLPESVLSDPYNAEGMVKPEHERAAAAAADPAAAEYERVLSVGGSDVIGELSYARLGISLPIYHGTSEASLSRGIGHLYGSSLPVGGEGTHSVLTAHSGLVNAALFTKLPSARVGDVFEITVLGERQVYEVDAIETTLPVVTEALRRVPGEERVTLLTCTPIGVNSHRLLVHAKRIATPPADDGTALGGIAAGVPWWALGFLGGSGAVASLLWAPRRTQHTNSARERHRARSRPHEGRRRAPARAHPQDFFSHSADPIHTPTKSSTAHLTKEPSHAR